MADQAQKTQSLTETEREFIALLGFLPFETLISQIESVLSHSAHLRMHIERALARRYSGDLLRMVLGRIKHASPNEDTNSITADSIETEACEQTADKTESIETATVPGLRVDAELGRLAVALKQTSGFRLWLIARHLSTEGNDGCGWLDINTLKGQLMAYGLQYSKRHLRRMLKGGIGIFWHIDQQRERLYLRGISKVSATLTEHALTHNPALVETNRPGQFKPVYIPLQTSLEGFEAWLYAGWLTAKNAPTIARETLEMLFHRTAKTIRQWEQNHLTEMLDILPSFAQIADAQAYRFPEHAFSYVANVKNTAYEIRVRWQLPNTYVPRNIRQHAHYGQARRVRASANHAWLKHVSPVDRQPLSLKAEGSQGRINETTESMTSANQGLIHQRRYHQRRYFETRKQFLRIKRSIQRRLQHTDNHPNKDNVPRYLFLGRDARGHNIYEPTEDGYTETSAYERVHASLEGRVLGHIRGTLYTKSHLSRLRSTRRNRRRYA